MLMTSFLLKKKEFFLITKNQKYTIPLIPNEFYHDTCEVRLSKMLVAFHLHFDKIGVHLEAHFAYVDLPSGIIFYQQ
jgi:hypothetical protein